MELSRARQRLRFPLARDVAPVLSFLERSGFFRAPELDVAREVIEDAVAKGPEGHYRSLILPDADDCAVGWVAWGPTPCTIGTWDIYWLGVDPRWQGRGYGRLLMDVAESHIRMAGGRLVVVETSGSLRYAATRAFYERIGYRLVATVPDFYDEGDPRYIYTRRIC